MQYSEILEKILKLEEELRKTVDTRLKINILNEIKELEKNISLHK